jgi:dTDP-4-amino-4,6-dideoxygalactose transaminase
MCLRAVFKAHQLEVIEDCSQAHGAEINGQKVGTFVNLSAFSCYPTKNLGGTGDGGVILCRSKDLANKINSLRQYGWNEHRESTITGFNSRLDEMQAAILRVKAGDCTFSVFVPSILTQRIDLVCKIF